MNEKLSISLPSELVALIKEQVESGRYASTSDMLQQAVEAFIGQDQRDSELDLEFMRMRTRQSLEDPRPSVPLKEGMVRLRMRLANLYNND